MLISLTILGLFGISNLHFWALGFLGLGYKSNTQCFEESYSVKMMKFLESLNIKVFYFDPYLSENFSAQKVETFDFFSHPQLVGG